MGTAACGDSYSFTDDPGGRGCSLGLLAFPYLLPVLQFTQLSNHSFTTDLFQALSQAQGPCPPRLVGKWAGGPGQG